MPGTLALAPTNDLHVSITHSFINFVDNDVLQFRSARPERVIYCICAELTEDWNVGDKIKGVTTNRRGMQPDLLQEKISILYVTLVK